jgi:hypothetical protein
MVLCGQDAFFVKVRLEMIRPNLISLWMLALAVSVCSGVADAQNYIPDSGPYQHQPLIQMPQSVYQPPIVDHYVQRAPRLWDDEQPVEWFLGELAKRSWLRVEYLHWETDNSGLDTAGAPVTGATNLYQATNVFPGESVSTQNSALLDLSSVSLSDASGARGTWGLALNGGQMELSVFGTQEVTDTVSQTLPFLRVDDAIAGAQTIQIGNIGVPLLTNGVVGTAGVANHLVFDQSVSASVSSQIWGSELALLTNAYLPGEGFHLQWLGGFRYVNLDEGYSIRGVDRTSTNAVPTRTTTIHSATINNVYGPQVGARASLVHRWFSLSATPRITFGLNDYQAQVDYDTRVSDGSSPTVTTQSKLDEIEFNTITQVNFLGEIHLSAAFSVYGGYDFMWMPQVARARDTVRFNSVTPLNAVASEPSVTVLEDLSSVIVQGLSVGATFRY